MEYVFVTGKAEEYAPLTERASENAVWRSKNTSTEIHSLVGSIAP